MIDLLGDDDLLNLRKRGSTTDPAEAAKEIRAGFRKGPAVNDALSQWQREQATQDSEEPGAKGPRTCRSCGASVSAKEHWLMLGICKKCVGEEKLSNQDQLGQVEENDWLLDD